MTGPDATAAPEKRSFVPYLDRFQAIAQVRGYKTRTYERLALTSGLTVLEVGGGTGDDAIGMAQRIAPDGRIVAVDIRRSLLDAARPRFESATGQPLASVCGTVLDLPFADATFHRCRADRVLQHVASPERAVAEMARVLRPAGSLLLCDTDWDTLVVDHPRRELTRLIVSAKSDDLASGTAGRALVRCCREAGLVDVGYEAFTLAFEDLELADAVVELRAAARRVADRGLQDVDAWLDDLSMRHQEGRFFCAVTGFGVWGVRPA